MSDLSKIKLVDGTILNLKDSESRQLIEDNKVIANPNKSPTKTLTKIEIGKDVYNIPSEGGGAVLDLIWDNDDDPDKEEKLIYLVHYLISPMMRNNLKISSMM